MTSNKFIGVWTIGTMQLSSEARERIENVFNELWRINRSEYFFSMEVMGEKIFVIDNGEMGFTAMLANEY